MGDFFDSDSAGTPVPVAESNPVKELEKASYKPEDIKSWLFEKSADNKQFCCMLYGLDGTGKTGLVQSYPLKDDEKMVILDLDGGNLPLLYTHHPDKIENIIVKNPLMEGDIDAIDYNATITRIRQTVRWVKENHKEYKIKAFCLDGLSTLLKHAEYLMRVEKHLTPDAGVSLRYWINRNKVFLETLEQIKSLPVDVFFIGHEDFIQDASTSELSSVKTKTNQMMYQKLRCSREDFADKVVYKAKVDKTKYKTSLEGKVIEFCVVTKSNGNVIWKGSEVLETIRGGK